MTTTETEALVRIAFLSDGNTAFPASVVAQWPEHNRARFSQCLYGPDTIERLQRERDEAVAKERERIAKECDRQAFIHLVGPVANALRAFAHAIRTTKD